VMIGSIAHAEGLACGEHPTVPPCVMIGLRESTAVNKVRARVLRGFGFCASTSRMRSDRSGGLHRRGGCLDSAGRLGRRTFSPRQSSSAAESISVAASFGGRCRLFRISPLCPGLLIYSNRDRRVEGGPGFGLARVGACGANWRKLGPDQCQVARKSPVSKTQVGTRVFWLLLLKIYIGLFRQSTSSGQGRFSLITKLNLVRNVTHSAAPSSRPVDDLSAVMRFARMHFSRVRHLH
jgi:hypothetical protein